MGEVFLGSLPFRKVDQFKYLGPVVHLNEDKL